MQNVPKTFHSRMNDERMLSKRKIVNVTESQLQHHFLSIKQDQHIWEKVKAYRQMIKFIYDLQKIFID